MGVLGGFAISFLFAGGGIVGLRLWEAFWALEVVSAEYNKWSCQNASTSSSAV